MMKRFLVICVVLLLPALACGRGGVRAQIATQTARSSSGQVATLSDSASSETPQHQASQPVTRPRLTLTPRARDTQTRPQTRPTRTLPPAVATRRALQGEALSDIPYCVTDQGVSLLLDIYLPRQAESPAPVVMYVHGGGWTGGDKSEGAGIQYRPELLSRGYIFVTINYRLAPEYIFPAQIEDVYCAVHFLRANAGQYGIDPERIGAIGGSAGGHLVSLLGTVGEEIPWKKLPYEDRYDNQSSLVQAVVDLFGPADLTSLFSQADGRQPWRLFGGNSIDDPVFALYSPVTYSSIDDPPFLILHGDKDATVPLAQSQALYDYLRDVDVPVELVVVKNAGHGFRPDGGEIDPSMTELIHLVANFFDLYLK